MLSLLAMMASGFLQMRSDGEKDAEQSFKMVGQSTDQIKYLFSGVGLSKVEEVKESRI